MSATGIAGRPVAGAVALIELAGSCNTAGADAERSTEPAVAPSFARSGTALAAVTTRPTPLAAGPRAEPGLGA